MAKNTPSDEPAKVQVGVPLGEWMTRMMERDNQMWDQLNQRDNRMQDQLVTLFSRMLDANSVDQVLVHGFTEMTKSIDGLTTPLRSLGREYKKLENQVDEDLATLNRALRRHDFITAEGESSIRDLPNVGPIKDRSSAS